MSLLLIQNPGVAPTEGFTLLGVSTTRGCGVAGTIGQFGSGSKHSINVLLRAGLSVTVYCGKTKMEFLTRDEQVNDGLGSKTIQRVYVKFGGTSTKTLDLGWVLDFGAIDWNEMGMAVREFVSNAIDRTLREECGQFEAAIREGRLSVRKVAESDVRAKDGYTRIYVQMNDEVEKYLSELPKRFLHFSNSPSDVTKRLLPKAGRNLTDKNSAMIYREGVFVRELTEHNVESIYDYNFPSGELVIDESRNSNEYAIRATCAKYMRDATTDELIPIMDSLSRGNRTFESDLDSYYLADTWITPSAEQKANWGRAWESVAGGAVMCDPSALQVEMVRRKGFTPVTIPSEAWVSAAEKFGIPTAVKVLSKAEGSGRIAREPTPAAIEAVDTVWEWIESKGMTNGRVKPVVAGFTAVTEGEADCMGYYQDGVVHIRHDISSGGNEYLLKTALEECVHHATGSGDSSRDIQNFLIDLVVAAHMATV